ncbi:MAG: molybdopterin-binding protein [Coprococcus sp.]
MFVGDDTEAIVSAVRRSAAHADVILTTGGVSVGVKDLLPEVIENWEQTFFFMVLI